MEAELFSDFDGTAVEKVEPGKWEIREHIRNARKYPLSAILGYTDFVEGAVSVQGVSPGKIVTIRKERVRRRVTERTITELGLADNNYSPAYQGVHYAGNELDKANYLATKVLGNTCVRVGMIDDMPQKLVFELVQALDFLVARPSSDYIARFKTVIGIVNHPDRSTRMDELVNGLRGESVINVLSVSDRLDDTGVLSLGSLGRFEVDVVALPSYSYQAGVEFGERLVA